MESLLVEQSHFPRKQIKNPKRKTHQYYLNNHPHQLHQISRQGSLLSKNQEFDMMMMMMMHGGNYFLNNHPTTPYHHVSNPLQPQMSLGQQHQPALLPLPVVSRPPAFRSLPSSQPLSRRHSLATTPIVPRKTPTKTKTLPKLKKFNKTHDENINNNNSVQFNSAQFVGEAKETKESGSRINDFEVDIGPTKKVRPDPGSLAKHVTRKLLADLDNFVEMDNKFSGSMIFSLAPPPSCLPLPKFSLRQLQQQQPPRPRLSCNAEAAAEVVEVVDAGATDNIRKLLRLR